ncbi:5'-methylthioadenosine/S-adenosylhomocysteine nucleosidase [Sporosarcina sp. Sa2YVA2]|uniref:5'-methylthioadenosine/S-adenosylhomocysteine nucleosidase n=1 Tax=Sporosarcina quadrami TaxID=2762234 RepID=A0ABR8U5M4_9BACL|nr:5'-methylthioadenosine/S-adenosylhomocysteine nucleosidase [Sporosarcina quadrami]MBD7983085.1 5'-methylthioadenosine/S-adenosylhomocysteine nucleosidase [Sporosarcina quadrami]
MKIAVIGAMEQEVEILRGMIGTPIVSTIGGCEFIEGDIDGREVVLAKSGIGKVNAAIATTLVIQQFKPDIILNTGSAGGFGEALEIGTVVISDEVTHHDVDVTAFGYVPGQVPGMPETFRSDEKLIAIAKIAVEEIGQHPHATGLIASGDVFMSDRDRVADVRKLFPTMIAAEMEAAAVAQVCHQFGTPFVVIRALSDIAGKDSSISFDEFLPIAAKHSSEIVMQVISKL